MAHATRAEIGKAIHVRRTSLGMPQAELARRVGLERSMVSRIELGIHSLRADEIGKWADGLGVSVGAILGIEKMPLAKPARRGKRGRGRPIGASKAQAAA